LEENAAQVVMEDVSKVCRDMCIKFIQNCYLKNNESLNSIKQSSMPILIVFVL